MKEVYFEMNDIDLQTTIADLERTGALITNFKFEYTVD